MPRTHVRASCVVTGFRESAQAPLRGYLNPQSPPMRLSLPTIAATAALLLAWACTPKVSDATADAPKPKPAQNTTQPEMVGGKSLSPCKKFSDNANADALTDDYVVYRDMIKTEQVDKAYELWQNVYANAPAADGRRSTVMTDGVYFMEYLMSQTTDAAEQAKYRERVFELYDEIDRCYPEGGAMMTARKAFDYYYKYPDAKSKKEIYDLFKEAVDEDGMEVSDIVLNPMGALLIELHEAGEVSDAEAIETGRFLLERLRTLKAAAKTPADKERVAPIEGYLPERFIYFEQVEGFYDCAYFKERYLADLAAAPDDCTLLSQTIGYLRYGGCGSDDPEVARLSAQYNKSCRQETVVAGTGCRPNQLIQEGNYKEAIECLEERYERTEDAETRGKLAISIARIYYGSLRQFSSARNWARKAATDLPNSGEPYLLIGRLYASSGALCGTGTGYLSQRVVWVAIDQWEKAKRVDPSSAAEAQKFINQYYQYMPDGEQGFMNGVKPGESVLVDCWINERTTARFR